VIHTPLTPTAPARLFHGRSRVPRRSLARATLRLARAAIIAVSTRRSALRSTCERGLPPLVESAWQRLQPLEAQQLQTAAALVMTVRSERAVPSALLRKCEALAELRWPSATCTSTALAARGEALESSPSLRAGSAGAGPTLEPAGLGAAREPSCAVQSSQPSCAGQSSQLLDLSTEDADEGGGGRVHAAMSGAAGDGGEQERGLPLLGLGMDPRQALPLLLRVWRFGGGGAEVRPMSGGAVLLPCLPCISCPPRHTRRALPGAPRAPRFSCLPPLRVILAVLLPDLHARQRLYVAAFAALD
jgi:hypothetical protein